MTDDDEPADSPGPGSESSDSPTDDEPAELPSVALVEAVAAAKGVDPVALDPLGSEVDLDALDAFLKSSRGGQDTAVTVEFQGVRARIEGEGTVTVRPSGADAQGADP